MVNQFSLSCLKTIRHLLELIRFSHTLFALPFALLAAVMAWGMNRLQFELVNFIAETSNKLRLAAPLLSLKEASLKLGLPTLTARR